MAGSFGAGLYVLGKSSKRAIVFGSTPRSTGPTRPRPWRRRAPRAEDDVFTLVDEIAAGILGNMDGAPVRGSSESRP